jgi:N-carbamoylputrescine amidase
MRVTVCQLHDEPDAFDADWSALCAHARRERSELVLLPEMPFGRWFAVTRPFEGRRWREAIDAHRQSEPRLAELGVPAVIYTRPTERFDRRLNEANVVTAEGSRPVHDKRYLPDEEGYWEASWYEAGDGVFDSFVIGSATLGAQICTEMWMLDVSRQYGLRGTDIIAVPRVTPASSRERWLVGGRAAAIVSGAFCVSSNRCGISVAGDPFGGQGWIIGPDGDVLAITSDAEPFATRTLDLAQATSAKTTYPRYVR